MEGSLLCIGEWTKVVRTTASNGHVERIPLCAVSWLAPAELIECIADLGCTPEEPYEVGTAQAVPTIDRTNEDTKTAHLIKEALHSIRGGIFEARRPPGLRMAEDGAWLVGLSKAISGVELVDDQGKGNGPIACIKVERELKSAANATTNG